MRPDAQQHCYWPARVAAVSIAFFLGACSSDDPSTFDDGDSIPSFRLTTEFQGDERPLGLADVNSTDGVVELVDTANDTSQRWRITESVDGSFRLSNVAAGDELSLDIINDGVFDDVRLQPTDDVTGQQWKITRLDNGYCRLSSTLLGDELSLDIVNSADSRELTMAATASVSGQYWRLQQTSGSTNTNSSVPLCTGRVESTGDSLPTSSYRRVDQSGFTLLIHPDVDATDGLAESVIDRLESSINAIDAALDSDRSEPLRDTTIWIEAYESDDEITRFYSSIQQLENNGLNTDKFESIEIRSAIGFIDLVDGPQPWVLMHELALARAFAESGLLEVATVAFESAIDDGLYDAVETVAGTVERAFAANSVFEYFAELTEAYLGRNDFFPFTRADLLVHDIVGFLLMQRFWD